MAHTAALDMTQGSLSRQIIGFSLPLMFTNLLQMLFSMVDNHMQYQIRDPKGFAKMLDTLIEKGVPVQIKER